MIDTTDGTITAAGWAGLFAFYWNGSGTTSIDYDYFGWDTAGGSPVPGPPLNFYTIPADSSSYALTGQLATLTYGQKIAGIAIGTVGIPGLPVGAPSTAGLKL